MGILTIIGAAGEAAGAISKVVELLKTLNPDRSVVLEVQNRTTNTLRRVSEDHDAGGFAEPPSVEIPPGQADVFGSRDNSVTEGTKGSVTYDSTDGFVFTVKWENPNLGNPSCDATISPGAFKARHTCGVGERAQMQFIVEPGITLPSIQRKSTAEAGIVSEIVAGRSGPTSLVTAVRTAVPPQPGTLKLIPWAVGGDGSISRIVGGDAEAGAASSIDIAQGRLFITACRTSANNLKLIGWDIAPNGPIRRSLNTEAEAGEADLIRIVALSDNLFLTAVRTGSGDLKLIVWELTSNDRLVRRGDSVDQAGEVQEISLVRISPDAEAHRVVTSVRAGNGELLMIAWRISSDGRTIKRLSFEHGQAFEASMIRSVVSASGHVVTSMRDGSGDLLLIAWHVDQNGGITRSGDSHGLAGEIFDNAIMSRPPGVLSAVNTGSGLKLIGWRISTAGSIERIGDSGEQAGQASLITLCPEPVLGEGPVVTAVRSASNTLVLISWDDHQ